MKIYKTFLIFIVAVVAVIIMAFFWVQSFQNNAISYEEAVYTAESDLKVQEKRRVDLVYNLADCVKEYNAYEAEVLTELADNMSDGNSVGNVTTSIAAIGYSYPQLESDENYKQFMTELATTENLIAQYRENYNSAVNTYNRYIKKFPARVLLDMTGYETQDFERLDYNAPVDAPQDLFGE